MLTAHIHPSHGGCTRPVLGVGPRVSPNMYPRRDQVFHRTRSSGVPIPNLTAQSNRLRLLLYCLLNISLYAPFLHEHPNTIPRSTLPALHHPNALPAPRSQSPANPDQARGGRLGWGRPEIGNASRDSRSRTLWASIPWGRRTDDRTPGGMNDLAERCMCDAGMWSTRDRVVRAIGRATLSVVVHLTWIDG
jgi:hypothetical protein